MSAAEGSPAAPPARPAFDRILLRTERLVLRPLREGDAAELFAIFSDRRVARYLSRPAWTTIESAHERIAADVDALAKGAYVRCALELAEENRVVGECCLFNLVAQCRRAEVGYALAVEAWGRGLMLEAVTALLDFGFSQMELNRVEADIDPANGASARILDRLGFRREGHLRERWIVEGKVSDSALYGLLLSDWRSSRSAGRPFAAGGRTR